MRRRPKTESIWKPAAGYGLLLALGTFALQWLDYQRVLRSNFEEIGLFLIAGFFLALGVAVGIHLFAPRASAFNGNPQAVAALGISPRELAVLREIAEGRSNQEIADRLSVSPNTVKTHITRLFEKLGASRRTDAIARARELGIIP
jgi:DNA-binding CsgD family transcriptional regulator